MKEKKFDYRDYISKNKFVVGKVAKTSNFENSVFEKSEPLRTVINEGKLNEGYSLYYNNKTPWTDQEWKKLQAITKKAIAKAKKHGIVIRDWDGSGSPTINDKEIRLNGDAKSNLDHETFSIEKAGGVNYSFTKTARKPYDAVVATILSQAKKIKKDLDPTGDDGASSIKDGGTEGWDNQYY